MAKKKITKKDKLPKVGDKVYVETHMYISHGEDDVDGGLATVCKAGPWNGSGWFIEVKEHPGHSYNWDCLKDNQKQLKKEFGKTKAKANPDFNTYDDPNEWKQVH